MTSRPRTSGWDRYWFATSTSYHYGLFRILFVTGFFLVPVTGLRFGSVPSLAERPLHQAFVQPTILVRLFRLPVPAPGWLFVVAIILAALAAIGVATRLTLIMLASLNLYLGSTLNSYGFVAHDTTVPSLFLVVLALSPGVSALSLDAYVAARRGRERDWIRLGAPLRIWPVRLLLILLATSYFTAGYAKLRASGMEWASGRTLKAYITDPQPAPYFLADPDPNADTFRDGIGLESFLYSSGRPTSFARSLARSDLLMAICATTSLLWELSFPVVLVVRRALLWYLLLGVAFHAMVSISFGLHSFYAYTLCYFVFVDWPSVADWCRRFTQRFPPTSQRARRPT